MLEHSTLLFLPTSDQQQQRDVLTQLAEKYTPGRHVHVKGPSDSELKSTAVLAIPIVEVPVPSFTFVHN